MSVLELSGVDKSFRGLRALSDVDMAVSEGEIVGVIGPNGAGKTTLFNVICGALKPDAGSVRFAGEDVTGHKPEKIARSGMVRTFQLMRPFATMSVAENVSLAAQHHTRGAERLRGHAVEIVERVGLREWAYRPATELPTAGLKRLELARALAARPRVLLLDEVLAGLLPAEREPVLDLLAELREQDGTTLVFIEHIMAAVMRLSDRVLVLDQGAVLATGTPDEVTADPRVIEAYLGEEPTTHADA
ncbi:MULTISPECIES: ABC transporter ATP-binding protein [Prauserella salsuginis group]|uniref:Branched-chain amino acid transport system ATP-binding protein n=2 Tax=Prauserella salsuginis group TaxID=2893672 RepID=A0A839XYE4_9PSEU|nr:MULTISPECIES: ABC transporter ATP-binding protein [Prauserella salsuginis group]MBB3664765.1 branched-chain amino acid transport system ATP-binding protein [Prauserella sediminis]MCR3722231.1 branched-chain amino acid transport system ATP-binding protein [Prauserella flava]MCR3736229.1 branched-chain amino acid transport system ATP-binding protein [Prauserella salsuginis]